jgi:hypothetical protein
MDSTTITGIAVIVGCAVTLVALYAWSAARIETIHGKKLRGLRQIRKEFGHGRSENE